MSLSNPPGKPPCDAWPDFRNWVAIFPVGQSRPLGSDPGFPDRISDWVHAMPSTKEGRKGPPILEHPETSPPLPPPHPTPSRSTRVRSMSTDQFAWRDKAIPVFDERNSSEHLLVFVPADRPLPERDREHGSPLVSKPSPSDACASRVPFGSPSNSGVKFGTSLSG